jgi:UbiD family decarboxylase
MGFRDLRVFLAELEARGLLRRVQRPIDKDTELMPLVRWQFRGQPESQRKAWLFENVVDQRGRRYGPVAVGVVGGAQATRCPSTRSRSAGCTPSSIPCRPSYSPPGP